eukprot:3453619-Prorocentrum_lima.AAC.1
MGFKAGKVIRNLGTDVPGECRRRLPTALSRNKAARKRHGRLLGLHHVGATTKGIYRASPSAQRAWGSAVHGVAPSRLKAWRREALRHSRK